MNYFHFGFIIYSIHIIGGFLDSYLLEKKGLIKELYYHVPITLRPISFLFFTLYFLEEQKKKNITHTFLYLINIAFYIKLIIDIKLYFKNTTFKNTGSKTLYFFISLLYTYYIIKLINTSQK